MILQGFPQASTLLRIDLVTTLPAPIVTLSPMEIPGKIILPPPIQTLFPIVTGAVWDTANGKLSFTLLLLLLNLWLALTG